MTSDEIRERYLSFFEERGHRRIPSASLVPSAHDPSALLTVAGMHPLKPYFLGQEVPPAPRLTDCQKVFRTVDIDNVGNTARHLTFFEMLGNFSFGDYFKSEAIAFAWELSREVFGFREQDIWVTVFEGDEELGLGPDAEAIERWLEVGMPRERIVLCPRSENFWQAGPTGPCGPCSELYLDRGPVYGPDSDRPGGDTERFLEYWNLVFMQYDQRPAASGAGSELKPLPANNIDTGLGLNRMAAILQDKPSVFETDQFMPLIELGEELSGASYGADFTSDRALRILADHARACTFLIADGVVPSNEDRGYVLRRVMRRAIHQGRVLELAPGLPGPLRPAGERADGRRLPRTARAGRRDRHVARGRGAELRADARPGHPDARGGGRACPLRGRRRALGRGRLPPARHLRAALRHDPRAARRGGPLDRGGLPGADGRPARARPGRHAGERRRERLHPRP